MSKLYTLGKSPLDNRIIVYKDAQQAELQGVRAIEIEADSYQEACELLGEIWDSPREEE